MKKKIWMAGILLLPITLWAQTAPADNLYPQALEAYLSGDVDQAILIDTKALQANPKDLKATNLLDLLAQEKSRSAQSVIWIGSEASLAKQTAQTPPAVEPATKIVRTRYLKADTSQIEQLEGEVKTLQGKGGLWGSVNFWVIILALLVSLLSLYSSWKARREAARVKAAFKPREWEESSRKVLDFRRFGNG